MKYIKSGYDGTHISINDKIAEWGESQDGYRIVPSWAVPAIIVASLTVAKIMKYNTFELGTDISNIFNYKK
jgi:hypothetical protein